MKKNITSTQIVDIAHRHDWSKIREAVYGQGGENDVFRNSAEATAMAMFINSRQDWCIEDIRSKLMKIK